MRKRFEQQNKLDATPISEVYLNPKSRDALPKLLAGLIYIFKTPEVNEQVFKILEEKVVGEKQNTGRLGMSLWEIFVLGVVRLNLNTDYDRLQDSANNHRALRGVMGVDTKGIMSEVKHYELQTIKDNVRLLDEETLCKINEVIVKTGHSLKKKKRKKKGLPWS